MSQSDADRGCDQVLLVQAEFDGELDAAQAAALAVHRQQCPVCQAVAQQLAESRELMREVGDIPLPEGLRERVLAALDLAPTAPPAPPPWRRLRTWWGSGTSFGLGAACAAALAFLVVVPGQDDLTRQIVAGHIRALQPGHLEDVISTDRHTVKPWFDGRLDFAPPVKDLAAVGFPLKGGRLDYIGGKAVAALVYQRDQHLIDLFVWPSAYRVGDALTAGERQGYNFLDWQQGGMIFWAVSDLEASQLRDFAEAWKQAP
jgi:anti-sigma factor RsiW